MSQRAPVNPGLLFGVGAYLLWGLMPLYFRLIGGVPATQVLAHRVLWSVALLLIVVAALRRFGAIRAAATPRARSATAQPRPYAAVLHMPRQATLG